MTIIYFRSRVFGIDTDADEDKREFFFVWISIFAPNTPGLGPTYDTLTLVAITVGLGNVSFSAIMRFNYLGRKAFPSNLGKQYVQA